MMMMMNDGNQNLAVDAQGIWRCSNETSSIFWMLILFYSRMNVCQKY